jgi:BRO1-like domain
MYLHFDDLYTKANSPPISLDSLAPDNSDATVLAGIRELSLRRNQSVGRECCKFETSDTIEKHIHIFEKYLGLLQQFISAATTKHWALEMPTAFQWSSPLSSLPASSQAFLPHVLLEFTMALCFYAAALQENAWRLLQKSIQNNGGGGGGETSEVNTQAEMDEEDSTRLTNAASLLRKAAGVYIHIRTTLLPEIDTKKTLPSPRISSFLPLELDSTAVEVLETMALAQAQGVAAERAERKGASYTAIAAVHRGALDLYETAAAKLKQTSLLSTPPASERFRMWLALSAELHAIKALRAQAGLCRQEGELGQACACLKDAILRIQRCLSVVTTAREEAAGWKTPNLLELRTLESVHAVYDRERSVVYVQGIASVVPPPPPGKIIIAPAVVEFLETSTVAAGVRITEHYFI